MCSESDSEDESYDDSPLAEAQEFASQIGGRLLSTQCSSPKQNLLFECSLLHTWEMPVSNLHNCTKCERLLTKARAFAEKRGGKVLSTTASPEMEFQCHAGHTWKTTGFKHSQHRWCAECIATKKAEKKARLQQEKSRIQEEQRCEQQRLFNEARSRMDN